MIPAGVHLIGGGLNRPYVITCGLHPGYGLDPQAAGWRLDPRDFIPVEELITTHAKWMAERLDADLLYLTGIFHEGQLSYAWRDDAGTVAFVEPVVRFVGEASPVYHRDVSDRDIENALNDLAALFAAAARQTRIYLAFGERSWALEVDDPEHPSPHPAPPQ